MNDLLRGGYEASSSRKYAATKCLVMLAEEGRMRSVLLDLENETAEGSAIRGTDEGVGGLKHEGTMRLHLS